MIKKKFMRLLTFILILFMALNISIDTSLNGHYVQFGKAIYASIVDSQVSGTNVSLPVTSNAQIFVAIYSDISLTNKLDGVNIYSGNGRGITYATTAKDTGSVNASTSSGTVTLYRLKGIIDTAVSGSSSVTLPATSDAQLFFAFYSTPDSANKLNGSVVYGANPSPISAGPRFAATVKTSGSVSATANSGTITLYRIKGVIDAENSSTTTATLPATADAHLFLAIFDFAHSGNKLDNKILYLGMAAPSWAGPKTVLTAKNSGNVTANVGGSGNNVTLYRIKCNAPPIITVTSPTPNQVFSEVDGYNNMTLSGTIKDPDDGNTETVYCRIDGDTGQAGTQIGSTITANGSDQAYSGNVNISALSEGNHVLYMWVQDNKGGKSAEIAIPFKMDKSAPALNIVTVTPSINSITISGSATDSTFGLDSYPYRYTVGTSASSWVTSTSYTKSSLEPNTRYTAKFEARDTVGHIVDSTKNIYTMAQSPTLAVNNPSSYTLDVKVSDNNPAITQYQITSGSKYVTTEGILTASPAWLTLTNKAITVSGLNPSTAYTFQVKAKNGDGIETTLSSPASGTTLVAPPGSPANITATATNTSITVTWDAVVGAISYDIEVDGNVANNGTNTTYAHSNLTPGTPHTYRIRANNAGGNGNWSAPITKSTSPDSPFIPLNINAAATDTKVILTWDAVAGATGYDIEVDSSVVNNGSSTNYVHSGLLPGTTHSYRVRSINAGGKSEWSSEVLVTTQMDTPQIPSNIETMEGKTQIVVTWDAVAGATGYDIEVDGYIADNGTRTAYTHSNLTPGTPHTYRVRSKKQGAVSDWSALVTTATLEDVFGRPTNFKAAATNTTVTLTWDPVYEATGYDVEADGEIIDNGTDTSCIHQGLEPGSSHTYRVRAKKGEELSDWTGTSPIVTYALPTPENLAAISTQTSITTVWEAVYGAESYDLWIDESQTVSVTGAVYHEQDGLKPNTQHTFQVRACGPEGTSAWSDVLRASTLPSGTFSDIPLSAIARDTSVTLLWSSVQDAEGYDLEIDGVLLEDLAQTRYLHEGLSPGTQYVYRLKTRYNDGTGQWSEPLTVSTLPQAPGIPTNITLSSTTGSILVTWDMVTDAAGYDIEVDGSLLNNGTGTSYLHTGLSPESQHTYRVRSKNTTATSPWSDLLVLSTKSSVQSYTIDAAEEEAFNLIVTAANLDSSGEFSFTITYNPEELEVIDLCSTTPRIDTTVGNIIGTDLQVTQFAPGTIVFKKIGGTAGQTSSGYLNSLRFRAKISGPVTITYSIQ